MPDKKLTDAEIVKALERLKNTKDYLKEQYREQVKKCPYAELKSIAKQTYEDNKRAFDIAIKAIEKFNRQKAEIERLKTSLNVDLENFASEYDSKIKAEAIKEFAKFCIDKSKNGVISIDDIADYAVDFVNSGYDMTVLTERIDKEC